MPEPANVTVLLHALRDGDRQALDRLFPLVYRELHDRAHQERRRLGGHATMNTTALVHEAYLKLAKQPDGDYASRAHFYAVAAKAMRHIFLDYAKRRTAVKRGGANAPVSLDDALPDADGYAALPDFGLEEAQEVLRLNRALEQLEPRHAHVVECRFFGGMSVEDTAAALGVSPATVKRDWVSARIALWNKLRASGPADGTA
jgi:RNA polymerase sigma factor (TIGR02999 family)